MAAYYNEFDPYAAQWLRNLIAAGHIASGEVDERSIVDVSPADLKGFTQCHFFAGIGGWSYGGRLAGWPDDRPLWTGSCPCQPFSVAGKGEGEKDERHLWPVLFGLVAACRPDVLMGEQVAAAVGKDWLDGVCVDLEGIGYACGAAVVPACAVDAPHRRDRLWFVADPTHKRFDRSRETGESGMDEYSNRSFSLSDSESTRRLQRGSNFGGSGKRGQTQGLEQRTQRDSVRDVVDSFQSRLEGHAGYGDDGDESGWDAAETVGSVATAGGSIPDADELSEGQERQQRGWQFRWSGSNSRDSPWAYAEWAVGADGKARRVEPGIRLLAHGVPARVGKLRAYGNAIVPQVAAQVIGAYMDTQG